jgi:hypothetical protein
VISSGADEVGTRTISTSSIPCFDSLDLSPCTSSPEITIFPSVRIAYSPHTLETDMHDTSRLRMRFCLLQITA